MKTQDSTTIPLCQSRQVDFELGDQLEIKARAKYGTPKSLSSFCPSAYPEQSVPNAVRPPNGGRIGTPLTSGKENTYLQILLVHGERPLGHDVGVEAAVDRLLAGLSELASALFVAQQGGKLVG